MSTPFRIGKPNSSSFEKRSNKIFDVFTKTADESRKLNAEIALSVKEKEAEIAELQSEVSTLNGIAAKNEKLATKIEAFINS